MNEMQANFLDNLQIATPCSARWERMIPLNENDKRDTVRFCQSCRKNVYNVSMMSRAEADQLILQHEGKGELCIRMSKREDGTVITNDCPLGQRKIRRSMGISALALALLAMVIPSPVARALKQATGFAFRSVPAFSGLRETRSGKAFDHWLNATPPPTYSTVTGASVLMNN